MKDIKQIRENFDLITEKEEKEGQKLSALVRAGLYDAKKLPALKKALDKSADKMTGQEKRMLINLLDSLIAQVTSDEQVYRKVKQNVHTMNEAKEDYLSKFDPRFKAGYPSDKDIPTVLILKRKAIRVYPDNQKVALYYSQTLDKYVTIPFSDIQTGLNEAKKDDDDEDKKINKALKKATIRRKPKNPDVQRRASSMLRTGKINAPLSDKISQAVGKYDKFRKDHSVAVSLGATWREAAKNKVRKNALEKAVSARKDPQSSRNLAIKSKQSARAAEKVKTQRTDKIDKWKTSGKHTDLTQTPPPKPVSAAFQGTTSGKIAAMQKKSMVEENYRMKLQQLREQKQVDEGVLSALDTAADIAVPYYSAGKKALKGDWKGAAADAATDTALIGVGALTGGAGYVAGKAAKAGIKLGGKLAKSSRTANAARLARNTRRTRGGKRRRDLDIDLPSSSPSTPAATRTEKEPEKPNTPNYNFKATPNTYRAKGADPYATRRERTRQTDLQSQQAMMRENVLSTLKTMVNEDIKEQTVTVNEQQININNTVAKKIVLIYESVNSTNKKKMEKMLNESAASFNKVLTFALRQ